MIYLYHFICVLCVYIYVCVCNMIVIQELLVCEKFPNHALVPQWYLHSLESFW
jgi:hypothetical protein